MFPKEKIFRKEEKDIALPQPLSTFEIHYHHSISQMLPNHA